jgi:hypothetical protein
MHPLPNPRPRKQLRFACCGRSFRPEGRGLNQQGKLIKRSSTSQVALTPLIEIKYGTHRKSEKMSKIQNITMDHLNFTNKLHEYSNWRNHLVMTIKMYQNWRKRYGLDDSSSTNTIMNILQSLSLDRVTLAFVAEFSRGKTELINSLFFAETGVRLLPSSPGRTTMCPAELFYDEQGGNYIRLLEIETRFEETSFTELKLDVKRWTQINLERDNPSQMQAAFQALVAVKHVPKKIAIELGLFDEKEAAEQGIINPETVEIPRWRHALISFSHPLLQAGLGILDTPGLNALGSEPELTLSMLPSAQAIIFVLGADTGVTKSDLSIWNNHICRATNASKQGLAIVMNKIDAMWDDLSGEDGYEKSIRSQITTSASILGISGDLIFPVSAKQALLAKLKDDKDLLERSRINSLEKYLSQNILNQRQKILIDVVLRDIGFLIKESFTLTEINFANQTKQFQEFQQLRFENQGMIDDLVNNTNLQQEAYFKMVEHFKVSCDTFSVKLNSLINALSPAQFDKVVSINKIKIDSSITTYGMKHNIEKLFEDLRHLLDECLDISNETQLFILKRHSEFNNEYGFQEIKPNLFSINDYHAELEELFTIGEDFRASTKIAFTEKSIVIQKLYNTIVFQARTVISKAHKDAMIWGENVLSPIKNQILDHKKQIENRLVVLRSANQSENSFNENISRLEKELEQLTIQRRDLNIIIKELQQASELPEQEPAS